MNLLVACSLALYEGLGSFHFPITTKSELAQKYFDQGVMLAHGFNHGEATRFFEHATELDPSCAMCYWGLAFALGPNINAPMTAESGRKAYKAAREAARLAPGVSERERAYIAALGTRYEEEPAADRTGLDRAFAEATGEVAARYPDDANAAVVHAEALMDVTPWQYWDAAGRPRETTVRALAALESVLARDENHPGANHLYIHAVETVRPELAVPSADRLFAYAPDAGHLVHMPSHIYLRIGRYADAARVNEAAIAADERFRARCSTHDTYSMMYIPHNHDFVVAAAVFEGRGAAALAAAEKLETYVREHHMGHFVNMAELQQWAMTPMLVGVQLEKWPYVLAVREPRESHVFARSLWHYARAVALAHGGSHAEADAELAKLDALRADARLEGVMIMGVNSAQSLLAIASDEAAGLLAQQRGDLTAAQERLAAGAAKQAKLAYMEPPPWHRSVARLLGKAELAAGKPVDAEVSFRADLVQFPENGWGLHGLAAALKAQGRVLEAAAVRARFAKAWARADVTAP